MIYLCAAPGDLLSPHAFFPHVAHAACHLEVGGRYRMDSITPAKGDLLHLSNCEPFGVREPMKLFRDLKNVCSKHALHGIVADLTPPVTADKHRFLSLLFREFYRSPYQLFVPEEYSDISPNAVVILCSAMSGGIFKERLNEAAERFGRHRLALDLQRLIMDFTIPAPTGSGTPMTPAQLKSLTASLRPAIFYSTELCAKYFTYRRQGQHHLILFDDTATLTEKIRIAKSMGISCFFFSYPDVSDILQPLSLAAKKEEPL